MTTKVTVHATHGWPVDVIHMPLFDGATGFSTRVEPGEIREFYVHSGQDIRVHEVQPDENF